MVSAALFLSRAVVTAFKTPFVHCSNYSAKQFNRMSNKPLHLKHTFDSIKFWICSDGRNANDDFTIQLYQVIKPEGQAKELSEICMGFSTRCVNVFFFLDDNFLFVLCSQPVR